MLNKIFSRIFVPAILLLIIVVYIGEFIPNDSLSYFEGILILVVIISGLFLAQGIPLYFSILALVVGQLLFWIYKLDYQIWYEGITKNLPLTILFVAVPVLSIPLKEGHYLDSFHCFLAKLSNKVTTLFTALTSILFALSSITNLGSIRILHEILKDIEFPPKFLVKVFLVGFSASIAWSPYFGSVNLAVYYTGITFNQFLPWGLAYGACLFIIGNLVLYRDKNLQAQTAINLQNMPKCQDESGRFKQLALVLLGLILVVVLGERIFSFSNMMLLVSVIAFIYAGFWSALINKLPEYFLQLRNYGQTILRVKNEAVFFLAVGFFGVILANTPLQTAIESLIRNFMGGSTFLVIAFIMFSSIILAALGVHMVILVTVLGLALNPETLGLHPIAFAMTLIGVYETAVIVCPVSPFNIISAGIVGTNPFTLCYRWNRNYAFLIALFSTIFVVLVNAIL